MFLGYIDPGTGFTILSAGGWIIAFLFGFFGFFLVFFKRILKFIKKHKGPTAIILLIILTGSVIIGVIMYKPEAKFDNKIIILGLDALSPEIIEPMMKDGKLPNFSRLKEQGSYKHLLTTNPSQSPVAWSGFATGQNPGKNGVFDFIVRDPKTYELSLSLSNIKNGKPQRVIKSKCFWQYASDKKVPTVVIAHPITFPPDKIYGRMLSGMGVPDILGTEGTFTFYTTEDLPKDKDIGGTVFQVRRSPLMIMNLIGPKVSTLGGEVENVTVPFKATLNKENNKVAIEYQNKRTEIEKGKWSDWQEVTFNLGIFRKAKGIFRFYLVEIGPEFKLYISPINFDPRSPFFSISYPPNYSKELANNIGLYYTQGMPMDTWAVNEQRLSEKPFLEQVEMVFKERKAMLDFELERFQKGVLYCYFESLDIIQHMFWRYVDARHPLYEKDAPQEYKDMIETWYKKMDNVLGGIITSIGQNDTLIVLSDHGISTFRRAVNINTWLRKNGYLELKNLTAETGRELLVDIDWSKTKAYAIGFGAIYINQLGREKEGIIKPGVETENLKNEIIGKMSVWRDEKYNEAVINKVYKREEIFWGEHAQDTPDFYIGFNKGYRASWQTALGAIPKELIEDNLKKWSGDHLLDPSLIPGVIFLNRQIKKENPSIYDITPTILKLIGYCEIDLEKQNFNGTDLLADKK
ncbi:MAG: alkaline phosphatase family protein [Candidatus Omnitrophota bacterium]|nr:alkaline phosphatase family protein [Candidatus Omnitrophota bacterium]